MRYWGLASLVIISCIFTDVSTLIPVARAGRKPSHCAATLRQVLRSEVNEESGDPFSDFLPSEKRFELRQTPRAAGGSQGGVWFKDKSGTYYFGKTYEGNEARLLNEHLTNEIYRQMGVSVPKTFLRRFDGIPYLLSEEVPGQPPPTAEALSNSDFKKHFVIDAWLANWDVVGLDLDNVILRDQTATRIDQGGALSWRAQGEKKPFGKVVKELESMRNPDYSSGEIFKDLSSADIAGQIRVFMAQYARNRIKILDLAKEYRPKTDPTRIAAALEARARWLVDVALPKYHQAALQELGPSAALDREFRALSGPPETWLNQLGPTQERFPATVKKLTHEEIVALQIYTGGDFTQINAALRGDEKHFEKWRGGAQGKRDAQEAYSPYIHQAINGLKKLPDFKGRVTRIVSLGDQQLRRYRVGAIVEEKGFTSTTLGTDPLSQFDGNVVFEITSQHGKDISFINPTEGEVLFPPKTRFKVTGRRFIKASDENEEGWIIQLAEP